MNNSIRDLETKGFVTLVYPSNVRSLVKILVEQWEEFTQLPEEVKKKFGYSNSSAGIGYEMKEGEGIKGDRKENFDFTIGGKQTLISTAQSIDSIRCPGLNFVFNASDLCSIIKPLIMDFALKAEQEFGIEGFSEEVNQSEATFFIRFIRYPKGATSGEETASAHPDQSGFTLHLFESATGLECLNFDRKWLPMPVSEGETVIIPSMQMQLRSGGKLKALYHRVVATEETSKNGRFSAVCFVQLKNTPKYDKARHGRLQEFPVGFNYDLLPEKFAGLFK